MFFRRKTAKLTLPTNTRNNVNIALSEVNLMEKRNFEEWLETFTDNINNWNYYVNYQTAYRNTATVKRQLALLNTLKGVDNIADLRNGIIKKCFI